MEIIAILSITTALLTLGCFGLDFANKVTKPFMGFNPDARMSFGYTE